MASLIKVEKREICLKEVTPREWVYGKKRIDDWFVLGKGRWSIPEFKVVAYRPKRAIPKDFEVRQKLCKLIGISEVPENNPEALDRLRGLISDVIEEKMDSVELVKIARGL